MVIFISIFKFINIINNKLIFILGNFVKSIQQI
jgi:hypothetical protein